MTETPQAPYPYFGGKSRAAPQIWHGLGRVQNFVDPFCGSLAVLLAAPEQPKVVTLNDLDGYLVNFWRSVKHDPEAVALHLDWPVTETDLFARHVWLVDRRAELTQKLEADPEFFDAKLAGWWCWGACAWIGTGWCSGEGPWTIRNGELVNLNDLGNAGQGVNRKLPHLGNAGRGVNRQLPHLGDAGRETLEAISSYLREYMWTLAARLRTARITCGDFERVLSDSVTIRHGLTGVLLDPPYDSEGHTRDMYSAGYDHSASSRARAWCIANGNNPMLRVVICGYDDEHDELLNHGWTSEGWKARKGYQSVDEDGSHNGQREKIWFSPHCLKPHKQSLFGEFPLAFDPKGFLKERNG